MGDTEASDGETELPKWGAAARRTTKRSWGMFLTFWVVGLVVRALAWLLGAGNEDIRQGLLQDLPWAIFGWPLVVGYLGSLAVTLLAGGVWLTGSLVAGYREPKAR